MPEQRTVTRLRLAGWHRGVYGLASTCAALGGLAELGPVPKGAATTAALLALVLGIGVRLLIEWAPAPIGAPRVEVAAPTERRQRSARLVLACAVVIAAGIASGLLRESRGLALAGAALVVLVEHLWDTSELRQLEGSLGPDEALAGVLWRRWQARRAARDR